MPQLENRVPLGGKQVDYKVAVGQRVGQPPQGVDEVGVCACLPAVVEPHGYATSLVASIPDKKRKGVAVLLAASDNVLKQVVVVVAVGDKGWHRCHWLRVVHVVVLCAALCGAGVAYHTVQGLQALAHTFITTTTSFIHSLLSSVTLD